MAISAAADAYDGETLWPSTPTANVVASFDVSVQEEAFWSVSDGAGGVITVWRQLVDSQSNQYNLRAQRLDADGNPQWQPGGVDIGNGTRNIVVAADGLGGVLVAWTRPSGADYQIAAQRLGADGVSRWPTIGSSAGVVVCSTRCTDADVDVSMLGDGYGGAAIGFNRNTTLIAPDGQVIFFDGEYANGQPIGVVPATAPYVGGLRIINDLNLYDVVYPPPYKANGAFAVWKELHAGEVRLYARHIQPDLFGIAQMSAPALLGVLHPDADYSFINDGNGVGGAGEGLLVTWKTPDLDIAVARLLQSGAITATATVLDRSEVGGAGWVDHRFDTPQIIATDAGGSIVAWGDFRSADLSDLGDVYVQRLDGNGVAQWTANGQPVYPATSGQASVRMTSDRTGGALIAFQEHGQSGTDVIRAGRVDANGRLLWTRVRDMAGFADRAPQIVFDDSGNQPQGAIVTWRIDDDGGRDGIAAEKIDQSVPGNEVCSLPVEIGEGSHTGALSRAAPDGSTACADTSGSASVWYRFTAPANGILHANTCGTNDLLGIDTGVDTVLSMYGQCPGDAADQLNCEGGSCCNDDFVSGADANACVATDLGAQRDAALVRTLSANESVLLRVAHHAGSFAGTFRLNLTLDATDSDGDGLPDSVEAALGTRTDIGDSDNDGISDFDEVNRDGDWASYTPGSDTDPGNDDTDGDGLLDGVDPDPLAGDATATEQVPLPLFAQLLLGLLLAGTARHGLRRSAR